MIDKSIQDKINEFRKKYYLNQIIKGSIFTSLTFLALYALFVTFEGIFWFTPLVRTVLFLLMVFATLFVFYKTLLFPILNYFQIKEPISDEQAAVIIGNHFPEIADKLLNYIQLSKNEQANQILSYALEQKKFNILPFDYKQVINIRVNWKYLRYVFIPVLFILFLFAFAPEVVTKGTYRLINFTKPFSPPPPFSIKILNLPKKIIDNEDFTLNIQIEGKQIPKELYVYYKESQNSDFQPILLKQLTNNQFQHNFSSLHNDFEFYVGNELYHSEIYSVQVIKRPYIQDFYVTIHYPAYTGLPSEKLLPNVGDISVLKGSIVTWTLNPKGNIKTAYIQANPYLYFKNNVANKQIFKSENYSIHLISDENLRNVDTVNYQIQVIEDKYPEVQIISPNLEFALPTNGFLPLEYEISDDFGFSSLWFNYRFIKSNNPNKVSDKFQSKLLTKQLPSKFLKTVNLIDLFEINMEQGDVLEYSLTVFDNDAISGFKSTTSQIYKVNYMSISELYENQDKFQEKIEENLRNSLNENEKLVDKFEKFQKKLLENKSLDYEQKKEIQEFVKQQQKTFENIQNLKDDLNQMQQNAEMNDMYSEETIQKMEQLQNLIKEIENSDLRKQLDELLNKLNKNDDNRSLKQQLEQIQYKQENLQYDLERIQQLYKKLKAYQKADEILKKLEDLKQQQETLNQLTKEKNDKEDLKKIEEKQKQIENQFNQLKQDLNDLEKLNKDAGNDISDKMNEIKQTHQNIHNDLQKSSEQLNQSQKTKASQSQQNAITNMEKMKKQISEMMQEEESDETAENYETLRNLLKNLLKLSFNQEEIRDKTKKLRYNDPLLKKYLAEQKKLRDNMEMVKDSLFELAKRVFQIKKYVTDEVGIINMHMDNSIKFMSTLQVPNANNSQHYVMTSLNNLANMLTESLDQMQQQMKAQQNQKGGGGACKRPGGNNPSMQGLAKQQSKLNQMIQDMFNQGGQDPSKLEQMAKEQESIRLGLKQMYEKISKEIGEKGGLGNISKIMQDMQETEKELLNKQITAELLKRQQQILSRMLDYDKSIRQRDLDNKRQSKTGTDKFRASPTNTYDSNPQNFMNKENLIKNKLIYTKNYQNIIDNYFNSIK